jgi:hypothetical protein
MDLAAKIRLCQWFYHLLAYLSTTCSLYLIIAPAISLFLWDLGVNRSCFLKQLQLLWHLPIQQGICYIGLAKAIWGQFCSVIDHYAIINSDFVVCIFFALDYP